MGVICSTNPHHSLDVCVPAVSIYASHLVILFLGLKDRPEELRHFRYSVTKWMGRFGENLKAMKNSVRIVCCCRFC